MFDNHFVCTMHPSHPLAEKTLTLKRFVDAEHLLVSLTGDASGIVDSVLSDIGRTRRIAMTVNSFSSAINLLKETQLISVLPYPILAPSLEAGELIVKAVPIDIPPAEISMAWHCRDYHNPGLGWLRETLAQIIASIRTLIDTKL